MKPLLPLLLSLLLATTLHAAPLEPIKCTGTWAPTITEQALIAAYGKANVTRGPIYVAEGNEEPGTILFPKDETQRLEIVWKDKRRYRNPEWIRIPAGSRWRTFAGIRGGMPLAELERLNARPFKFSGFDWDYGGFVTDWRAGKLTNVGAPCSLQVRLDRNVPDRLTPAQEKAVDATSGDLTVLSSSANARALAVVVGELLIQYP